MNSTGAIQEGYRYNEYGATTIVDINFAKLTTTVTSPVGNPHRYMGREEHNSVGVHGDDWYYNRDVEYRPSIGRYNQRRYVRRATSPLVERVRIGTILAAETEEHWCGSKDGVEFPDGWWGDCCKVHDECYTTGGDADDKKACDTEFLVCLIKNSPVIAIPYYLAVAFWGSPNFNWDTPPPPPPSDEHVQGQPWTSGNCFTKGW